MSQKVPTFKHSVTLLSLSLYDFQNFLHCWKAYEIHYKSLPFKSVGKLKIHFFSEREVMFMFVICRRRPSVCRLSSVCRGSVTFVHPTQQIEIFGNVSARCNTLVI